MKIKLDEKRHAAICDGLMKARIQYNDVCDLVEMVKDNLRMVAANADKDYAYAEDLQRLAELIEDARLDLNVVRKAILGAKKYAAGPKERRASGVGSEADEI